MDAFKTVRRPGVAVSGGDRVGVPTVVLETGALTETVNVVAEAAIIQTQSGERSFAVTSDEINHIPITHSNFTSLTALTP
jgi:hypothetical protein